MNRKGKRNWQGAVPDYEKEKEIYPQVVFQGFVDRNNFCGVVRIVEVVEDVFKFEKSDGDDAMKNPIWKPLRDEEYKGVAEHLYKKYSEYLMNSTD
jgi:hypothetical protein